MAPEVALSQPYGLPADVYSYGVFLFECCTLIKPFDGMTRSEHIKEVAYGRYRPSFYIFCATSKSLQKFIRRCWNKSPKIRPKVIRIVEHLQRELQTLEQENENKPHKVHYLISSALDGRPRAATTVGRAPVLLSCIRAISLYDIV